MPGDSEFKYDAGSAEKVTRFISSMENLLTSDGWKFYEKNIQAAEADIASKIVECGAPNDMLRLAGSMASFRTLRTWPARMLAQGIADLKRLNELQAKQEEAHGRRRRKL